MDALFLGEIMLKCKLIKQRFGKEVNKGYDEDRTKLRFNLNHRNE